jgi:hypothetical protein
MGVGTKIVRLRRLRIRTRYINRKTFFQILSGEERLKEVRSRRLVHAVARVGDLQHDIVPCRRRSARCLRGRPADPRCVDREPAAIGHRVPRIGCEIHQRLLQLAGVCAHRAGYRSQFGHEFDARADQTRSSPVVSATTWLISTI